MHEIPETVAQAEALVQKAQANGQPTSLDAVIAGGLQNWIQELLDEGSEGGYLTAKLSATGLTITDITGQTLYQAQTPTTLELVPAFKADAHHTLLAVQTTIRALYARGKL
ncbi:hypothetical protein [Lacticaseibacillus salsurivasis]|uniref:hypothetical protein n=1 Tax=Lacticaseibacillus salsurivasis TaxID=3081441 RepID=UPI0030C67B0D